MILAVVSALFYVRGVTAFYSALVGGVVFIIPNSYFAYKAFAYGGAQAARRIVQSFYKGEAVKLLLTAVLFAVVFIYVKPLDVLAMFLAYFVLLVSNWLVPMVISLKPRQ
ncbi:MAG: F0F1 ATP synthase subunit I [Gammaproteobacteria bacterium]|nr:MAG: F0F1 ATP synthase subunit I [Pseudomonadota bacterium]PIE38354.1 MAG: F0F1 ATP synthase subunit I [Gammaproteobacteria bacterium]